MLLEDSKIAGEVNGLKEAKIVLSVYLEGNPSSAAKKGDDTVLAAKRDLSRGTLEV